MIYAEFKAKYANHFPDVFGDALDHAETAGLLNEDEEVGTAGIYERAGLSGETGLDAAFNNHCQIEAGYALMTADDSLFDQ